MTEEMETDQISREFLLDFQIYCCLRQIIDSTATKTQCHTVSLNTSCPVTNIKSNGTDIVTNDSLSISRVSVSNELSYEKQAKLIAKETAPRL